MASPLLSPPRLPSCRQLYAQEAACRLQEAQREADSLQGMSKEDYLKMMLPDSPQEEDGRRPVSSEPRRLNLVLSAEHRFVSLLLLSS